MTKSLRNIVSSRLAKLSLSQAGNRKRSVSASSIHICSIWAFQGTMNSVLTMPCACHFICRSGRRRLDQSYLSLLILMMLFLSRLISIILFDVFVINLMVLFDIGI